MAPLYANVIHTFARNFWSGWGDSELCAAQACDCLGLDWQSWKFKVERDIREEAEAIDRDEKEKQRYYDEYAA